MLLDKEQEKLESVKRRLDSVSPSMCLAKWLQTSLHLATGKTHSCYHPPVHNIDRADLAKNPSALHNTRQKKEERALMLKGKRPAGCSYCWNIEDFGSHYSDRHYRSFEPWADSRFQEVVSRGSSYDVIPSYVEVNFNQACQFKCSYCSPHLSTAWMEEIKQYGPYPTIKPHNDIEKLKEMGLWPIASNESNPYVEAFWKWWPDLYPKLKVFRMTGGEPLIDHNTFRVLDYIKSNPRPDLELAITTNLCPPKKMMSRFQTDLKEIFKDKKIFRFMLFPSIDSWGPQAEYIRFGLNIKEFEKNVRSLMKGIPELLISFIVTANALSPFSIKKLLERILEWQKECFYLYGGDYRRIFLDLPYLRAPAWQALDILPSGMARPYFKKALYFMEQNKTDISRGKRYGFAGFQIDKMKRLMALSDRPADPERKKENQINFYRFFKEHDRRRGTNFVQTFPELKEFWKYCAKLSARSKSSLRQKSLKGQAFGLKFLSKSKKS